MKVKLFHRWICYKHCTEQFSGLVAELGARNDMGILAGIIYLQYQATTT